MYDGIISAAPQMVLSEPLLAAAALADYKVFIVFAG